MPVLIHTGTKEQNPVPRTLFFLLVGEIPKPLETAPFLVLAIRLADAEISLTGFTFVSLAWREILVILLV